MAKKRKLNSKTSQATEEEQEFMENDAEYDEELENDVEEEEEEEEDEEEETNHENNHNNPSGDDDDEPIQNLLEPFSKEQLVHILREAAETHADVAARVRKVADEDAAHRKIFVHGLGWDSTTDTLRDAFVQYGEIEDCKAVADKVSGKSKGYGFILFKSRSGARNALKNPQKKIGNRMTSCQLAAVGPVPSSGPAASGSAAAQPVSEYTQRKIFVSNVGADLDPQKLTTFFAKYGEIEEGPLGLDKQTGKPKGFCLFVYKSLESAKKALAEPHKNFEGHTLHCQRAIDGPKPGKQPQSQPRNTKFGRKDHSNQAAGGYGQAMGGVGFNQGALAAPALNPALGQALTALLATQGAGLGNLLGTLGAAGVGAQGVAGSAQGMPGGYGNQAGYAQAGLQSAYPNQQMGQGGSGRTQNNVGYMGGAAPYTGH